MLIRYFTYQKERLAKRSSLFQRPYIKANRLTVIIGIFSSFVILAMLILGPESAIPRRDFYKSVNENENRAPIVLTAGVYIQKLYDLDLQSKTFAADGYIWIKWLGELKAWDSHTSKDPANTLEFLNSVYKDDFIESLSPEDPYTNKSDESYQAKVFSGKFLATELDLRKFPFETIILPIEIETDDYWISEAVLHADKNAGSAAVSEKNSLNGYTYKGMSFTARKHIYNTAFGLEKDALASFGRRDRTEYSNIIAEFVYQRDPGSTAWRLFVPLLAVLWITILSPLIDPRNLEPKVALPASVVLSLVFLQQGYRDMLPDSISYLTFMDKVYGLSYCATFIVFLEAVVSTNLVLRLKPNVWLRIYPRLKQKEKRLHECILFAMLIGPPILWIAS